MERRRKIEIIQHNVQTWRTKKTSLCNIYNEMDPDIILLNETSVKNNEDLKIFNYNVYKTNKKNEDHAGAALAIKKNIMARIDDDYYSDMLSVSIPTRQGNITIATAYVPPRTSYLNFLDFYKLFNKKEPVYFFGDINARHRSLGNSSTNTRGRNLKILIDDGKCTHRGPHFPTWISHNAATSPDIALANRRAFHNIYLRGGPITPSDHIPVVATISSSPIQIPIRPRKCFHRADWIRYHEQLSRMTLQHTPSPTLQDIDGLLQNWTAAVTQAADNCIPTIKYRTIPGIKTTAAMRRLQQQYDAILAHIMSQGPSYAANRLLIDIKKKLQDEYTREQSRVWNKLIQDLKIQEDPKLFFKGIKKMMGNSSKLTAPYLKHDGKKLRDPEEKEPIFREHWKKIFTEDRNNQDFNQEHIASVESFMQENEHKTTPEHHGDLRRLTDTCPPITIEEFNLILKTFKQKAPGPSGITTLHLKKLPDIARHHLLNIFNFALSSGYFPDKLKHATMIFIPKSSGSQHAVENYRPISLLDVHGKLFDKILTRRLEQFLEIHGLKNPRQHGFRPMRGTHTALATLTETLARDIPQGLKTDIVLRDVAKAFDKVWHTGLKFKIIKTDIHPCMARILGSYLDNRKASIRIGPHTGSNFALENGVPQGACLSPALFTFYTHDLPTPNSRTDYIAYADDITQIITEQNSHRYLARRTKKAIQQVNDYEKKWRIKTNIKKFQVIKINRRLSEPIKIGNDTLEYSTKGTALGLQITSNGFSSQVGHRKAIALRNLNRLFRFRDLTSRIKRKLYLAYVRPALLYPVIPLHALSRTSISQLQKIQNKALRFIDNSHWTDFKTSRYLHRRHKLEPINVVLHRQAKKTWQDLQANHPELYEDLKIPQEYEDKLHPRFPSSRLKSLEAEPPPVYL